MTNKQTDETQEINWSEAQLEAADKLRDAVRRVLASGCLDGYPEVRNPLLARFESYNELRTAP